MSEGHTPNKIAFRLMSLEFSIRDRLRPPERILKEVGIGTGQTVLDFGCGPGGFAIAAAKLVGTNGRVYALDINPFAVQAVREAARKMGLDNLAAVLGGMADNVPGDSVDAVLLYDTLHDLDDPEHILADIHRVLRTGGLLSVSDHHLKPERLRDSVTGRGHFKYKGACKQVFQFEKQP